ncbi:Uncharacterised protein [Mycobacterium tuberculosis]|uniref:Uncharacterized protein n=1 Tax=Mycobacterium tuberculosis TaxID=1773 RepID=A0A655IVR9_MYCTX|nr:Uncharacterised protein [Mycobacterium tuberculosis]
MLQSVEALHGDWHRSRAALPERTGLVHSRSAVDRQRAPHIVGHRRGRQLPRVRRRNDIALFIFRHSQQSVHLVDLLLGHPDRFRDVGLGLPAQVDVAHVAAHRRQPPQHARDHLGVARGEQLGQIGNRNPQCVQRAEQIAQVLPVVPVAADRVDHRRQRRDVPDHRHGPVLRM